MRILKTVGEHVSKPFTHICNKSFESSVFLDKMKLAKAVPIFKSGEKNRYTNYRPVSLLPQFSKVLEKLFHKRLISYVEKYEILTDNQYGFRTKRSTDLALLVLMEDLVTTIDKKEIAIGIFIDF